MKNKFEFNASVKIKTGSSLDEHFCDYLNTKISLLNDCEYFKENIVGFIECDGKPFLPARINDLVNLALSKTKQIPSIKNEPKKTK